MSELTRCNYCSLADIRRRHPDSRVELRTHSGWICCYVDGQCKAMFLELTDGCTC